MGYVGRYGARTTNKLTKAEMEAIEVAWKAFKNENNKITEDTLAHAFEKINAAESIKDIRLLIDDIDENGDGMIDEQEFYSIMTRKILGDRTILRLCMPSRCWIKTKMVSFLSLSCDTFSCEKGRLL